MTGVGSALDIVGDPHAGASLTVDQTADPTDHTAATMSNTTLAGLFGAGVSVSYSNLTMFSLLLGSGIVNLAVSGTPVASTADPRDQTTIQDGPGIDTATVTAINGPTWFYGVAPTASVTVDFNTPPVAGEFTNLHALVASLYVDHNEPTPVSWVFTGTQFQVGGQEVLDSAGAGATYLQGYAGGHDTLTIANPGSADQAVSVQNFSAGNRVQITQGSQVLGGENFASGTSLGFNEPADGLFNPSAMATSPDGQFVYVLDQTEQAVSVYRKSTSGNRLTFIQIIHQGDIQNGTTVQGLTTPINLAFNPSGSDLYVTSSGRNIVNDFGDLVVFQRDPVTGLLTYVDELNSSAAGFPSLQHADGVAVSPDGADLYIGGIDPSAGEANVSTFPLTSSNLPSNFMLETLVPLGPNGDVASLQFTPDGQYLKIGSTQTTPSVVIAQRNSGTGQLSLTTSSGQTVGNFTIGASAPTLDLSTSSTSNWQAFSADGRFAYVLNGSATDISVYARDPETGLFTQFVQNVPSPSPFVKGGFQILVSSSNNLVYVLGGDTLHEAVGIFTRNATTGKLTYVTNYIGVGTFLGLGTVLGNNLYFPSQNGDSVWEYQFNPSSPSSAPVVDWIPIVSPPKTVSAFGANSSSVILVSGGVVVTSRINGTLAYYPSSDFVVFNNKIVQSPVGFSPYSVSGDFVDAATNAAGTVVFASNTTALGLELERITITTSPSFSFQATRYISGLPGFSAPWVTLSPDGTLLAVGGNQGNPSVVSIRASDMAQLGSPIDLATNQSTYNQQYGIISPLVEPQFAADGRLYVIGAGDPNPNVTQPNATEFFVELAESPAGPFLNYIQRQASGQGGAMIGLTNTGAAQPQGSSDTLYVVGNDPNVGGVTVFQPVGTSGTLYQPVQWFQDGTVLNNSTSIVGLNGAQSVVISPDGTQLFVLGTTENELAILTLNPATGLVTGESAPVKGLNDLSFESTVSISANGTSLDVLSPPIASAGSITPITRDAIPTDPGFGQLKVGTPVLEGNNTVLPAGVTSVAVGTLNGQTVYFAADPADDALLVLKPGSGTNPATVLQAIYEGSTVNYMLGGTAHSKQVFGLAGVASVAVSPDGQYVYAVSPVENAVVAFQEIGGVLAPVQTTFRNQGSVAINPGLAGANVVAISPDGHALFVAGPGDTSLDIFGRSTTTGLLTLDQQLSNVPNVSAITLSADSRFVYVTQSTGSVLIYSSDSASDPGFPTINLVQTVTEGGTLGGVPVSGLAGAKSLTLTPDGTALYVTGSTDNGGALAAFTVNTTTGLLSAPQIYHNGVSGIQGLTGA